MVVQSVALPKVTGSTSDGERAVEATAAPSALGSAHSAMVVLTLVMTQVAWLTLIGYAAFHLFA